MLKAVISLEDTALQSGLTQLVEDELLDGVHGKLPHDCLMPTSTTTMSMVEKGSP